MLKNGFSKSRIFCKGFPLQLFLRNSCKIFVFSLGFTKRGGLVRPPRKAVAFLTTPSVCQKDGTGISLPAGSDQGCSPWTSPTFLKNCWIKKLSFACGSFFWTVNFCKSNVSHETNQELLLEKTIFNIRQKGGPPLLLPTSLLQLPRRLTRTYNLTSYDTTLFELDSFKNAIAAGKQSCKIQFASQTWAARPHLGSIFKKLLHRKTFSLPAAHILQPIMFHPIFDLPAS